MNKIEEINKSVEVAPATESGRRTKAAAVEVPVSTFPVYGAEAVGFSKNTITPRSGSEFLLEVAVNELKDYGFELASVTHASLKFNQEYIQSKLVEKIPVIQAIKFVNGELIGVLDKHVFLKSAAKADLIDASCSGLNAHIDYEAIPKVLFSLTMEPKIYVMENDFIVKLNPNVIAINFLLKEMIVSTDVTISKESLNTVRNQILKTVKINSSISKKHLNIAVQFVNVDHLPDTVYLNVFEECLVAVNTQLTTDLFAIKANKQLKKMDQTAQCIFASSGDLLKNATKGDDISKCLVKPKAALSYVPIIKLSDTYLHPALTGKTFDPVTVEKKCDDAIIKEVFKPIINDKPVTIKSIDTDNLFLVPDVFKMLQHTMLKWMKPIKVGGELSNIQPRPLVTPTIRVNMSVNNSLICAIFTI